MGATDFTTIATAKTAELAYQEACSEARDYSGHQEGYSGDIQTCNGFVEIPESYFKGMQRKTRVMILEALALGDALGNPPSKKAIAVFASLRRLYRGTEKWGHCYAVKVAHNTYAFSGWAAC